MNNYSSEIEEFSISKKEKEAVKQSILVSIHTMKRRRRIRNLSIPVAASLILFFSVSLFNHIQDKKNINTYIQKIAAVKDFEPEEVELILANNEKVKLHKQDSVITYSSKGQKIQLGAHQTLSQDIENNNENSLNTIQVPYGKRVQLTLSDKTRVWLNSGSKMVYPAKFKGDRRDVFIEGEAIFEVAHNAKKPFHVLSKDHDIKVLGTVFNVSNYPGDQFIETTLKSGSVAISYNSQNLFNSKEYLKIEPGIMAVFNKEKGEIYSKEVEVNKSFSWRDGIVILENNSLKDISKRLERYYNVIINIEDESLSLEEFSGNLDLKYDITNVLSALQKPGRFNYELEKNNQITTIKILKK